MEQIYKNIHKDENDKYYFATLTDTIPIIDVQTMLQVFTIELLLKLNAKEEKDEDNTEDVEGIVNDLELDDKEDEYEMSNK